MPGNESKSEKSAAASIIQLANVAAYGVKLEDDSSTQDQLTTQDVAAATCDQDSSDSRETSGKTASTPVLSRKKSCPKQHQLPMFLSKTYHMIDRCDTDIATWSRQGDNFVIKNVEKFAATVLPQYFKHSNFSSFARQLNFYGFRKLKAEPILTADFDARTACYVRFYHEKFQKDRPELLPQIKRATKSDMQSKDDVEGLKMEISNLKDCMQSMSNEFDRKLAELSFDCNRRIASISSDYEKLTFLVQQLLTANHHTLQPSVQDPGPTDLMRSLSTVAAMNLQGSPTFRPQLSMNIPAKAGEKRKAQQDTSDCDTAQRRKL